MLTKGAIGNLVNRYKAVLKKCNLINTFGSLAVASMLVLGGAGVASAANFEGKNTPSSVVPTDWTFSYGNKIFGGWSNASLAEKHNTLNTSITVNHGELASKDQTNIANGMVIGGNHFDGVTDTTPFITESTEVIINYVQTETVIGGNYTYNSNLTFGDEKTGGVTNITINDGFFGKTTPDTNVPELYVLGGDWLKNYNKTGTQATHSTLSATNITINGGTFHSAIIGGSGILECYDARMEDSDVSVTTTNITIKGGEFNHPIIGGGLTWGGVGNGSSSTIKSTVNTSNINISGKETKGLYIKSDIYAGGIQNIVHDRNDNTVEKSVINIDNTTINSLYGTNVTISKGSGDIANPAGGSYITHWNYNSNSKNVNTELTLTNVKTAADGKVYIPDGTVALRSENAGEVFINELTVDTPEAITISTDGATNDKLDGNVTELKKSYIKANKIVYLNGTTDTTDDTTSTDLFAGQTVTMEAGKITGEVTAEFNDKGVMTSKTEKPNETNVAMADLPDINHMITRVEMNDLRKRMGDIRLLEGNTGVWARWDGGKLKGDSGLTNDFHKIQAGIDTTTGIDNLRLGAAFSYTNSDMEFAKADAESDTMSLAAYGVWTADNGMFADVIARLAFIDTEIQTDKIKGDLDNIAFSLSGEYGWRFDVCKSFFVEPQLELTYTYVDSDEFTSAGAKFDLDSTDSLIGRAGLAAGWKLPSELGELYARASVVQEFMGDSKLTASMGSTVRYYETDGDDTWFEYGVGANVKVTKNAYIFADVERTEGAEIDEEWRGTVGFRYSF